MKPDFVDTASSENQSKKPSMIAWQPISRSGKKEPFWIKVGACFRHKDGKGLTLILDAVPLSGKVVLRKLQENPE